MSQYQTYRNSNTHAWWISVSCLASSKTFLVDGIHLARWPQISCLLMSVRVTQRGHGISGFSAGYSVLSTRSVKVKVLVLCFWHNLANSCGVRNAKSNNFMVFIRVHIKHMFPSHACGTLDKLLPRGQWWRQSKIAKCCRGDAESNNLVPIKHTSNIHPYAWSYWREVSSSRHCASVAQNVTCDIGMLTWNLYVVSNWCYWMNFPWISALVGVMQEII